MGRCTDYGNNDATADSPNISISVRGVILIQSPLILCLLKLLLSQMMMVCCNIGITGPRMAVWFHHTAFCNNAIASQHPSCVIAKPYKPMSIPIIIIFSLVYISVEILGCIIILLCCLLSSLTV